MKRIFRYLTILVAIAVCVSALPSCHSAKKSGKSYFQSQSDALHKGKGRKHKQGDGGKVAIKSNNKIVKEAYTWLGTPYGYGKAEKGVACDCSGMVMSVYQKVAGVKLPRNSAKQSEFCKSLKKKDVHPGDLCFFATGKDPDKISHVGIMVDDKNFIHSSTSKGVVVSDITQPYYVRTFKGYGRVPD